LRLLDQKKRKRMNEKPWPQVLNSRSALISRTVRESLSVRKFF
jgi:hypothetical protein